MTRERADHAAPGIGPAESRRGAALFIVLTFSAFLAAIVGAATRTGLSGARAAAVFADAARADALGQAAGDIVVHQLMTGDAQTRRGGSLSVTLDDAVIAIDYVSESARVDVNTADIRLIAALLGAAGAGPDLTAGVVGRVKASRAALGGAQGPVPVTAGGASVALSSPSGIPQFSAPLEAVEAWGLPPSVARRILPALTVASGSKGVDPILADRLVVSALLGGDDIRTDDYLARRDQGFVNADSALALLAIPSRGLADFEDVPSVHAVARVTLSRRFTRSYDMVVAAVSGSSQMPVVIGWRKLLS